MTGDHPENPTLDLPCRVAFAAGQRKVGVLGPLLEDRNLRIVLTGAEAVSLQSDFWRDGGKD